MSKASLPKCNFTDSLSKLGISKKGNPFFDKKEVERQALRRKKARRVTFKLIESHGLPVCRERGTIVEGFLHAKECGNYCCDDRDSLGNTQFVDRFNVLEQINEREKWIDTIFDCFWLS